MSIAKTHPNLKEPNSGASWVVTVPVHFTEPEINQVIDSAFSLPPEVMGHLLIVREGVRFKKASE